ncbi:MAG: threonine ammonia-lyase [Desulfurococcales archaeon]|nr:threonine ammonia-lyase [Desulfurococcales archaeon]
MDTSGREIVDYIYTESRRARKIVGRLARRTPLDPSTTFSRIAGTRIYLKYENLQKTGSFKVRGALYKVSKLKEAYPGFVAASAGNHAQGVAFAASAFNRRAVIVMPETASISKIEATRSYGAEVVLHGRIYDEAEEEALRIAREKGYAFIHPFNDPDVIAGQGTIGFEILEDLPTVRNIVVGVGGGGLISGIAVVAKRLRSNVRVIGVEPENAPKMTVSLREGRPVVVEVKPTIADGLAVKKPGDLTFSLIKELADELVTVKEEDIAKAIYLLLERGKVLAEGAGAAPLAAIISGSLSLEGDTAIVISGGNIDLTHIYKLLLWGLTGNGRIATIHGYVPDVPGTLAKITSVIARNRGNIVEVLHDRADINTPAWHTALRISIEIPSKEAIDAILRDLRKMGYNFEIVG